MMSCARVLEGLKRVGKHTMYGAYAGTGLSIIALNYIAFGLNGANDPEAARLLSILQDCIKSKGEAACTPEKIGYEKADSYANGWNDGLFKIFLAIAIGGIPIGIGLGIVSGILKEIEISRRQNSNGVASSSLLSSVAVSVSPSAAQTGTDDQSQHEGSPTAAFNRF